MDYLELETAKISQMYVPFQTFQSAFFLYPMLPGGTNKAKIIC